MPKNLTSDEVNTVHALTSALSLLNHENDREARSALRGKLVAFFEEEEPEVEEKKDADYVALAENLRKADLDVFEGKTKLAELQVRLEAARREAIEGRLYARQKANAYRSPKGDK